MVGLSSSNKYRYLFSIKNCITSRPVNQNTNINNGLNKNISSTGHGGAIYIDTSRSLIINETTFYNFISKNSYGGAIYFTNSLNINLFKICAVECKTSSGFLFIIHQNVSLFKFILQIFLNKLFLKKRN